MQRAASEWSVHVSAVPAGTRQVLKDILAGHENDLRGRYLDYLASDVEIADILATDAARAEFTGYFMNWIGGVLDLGHEEVAAFCEQQAMVGRAMARIGLPPHALSRAMRKLKLWFMVHLRARPFEQAEFMRVMEFLIVTIDISVEIREESYLADRAGQARMEEAYRLQALGQNLALERERQRATLMEWCQNLLLRLHQPGRTDALPELAKSDFGLWLTHKAQLIFESATELDAMADAMERIDGAMIPAFAAVDANDRDAMADLVARVQHEVAAIKFQLGALFDARMEIENGRDSLTNLLSRRFLPTVMMREIALQRTRSDRGFCVVMLDVDRFKAVNDQYGHLAGDRVLQQVAGVLVGCARPSDFHFRYGGEEMVLVLVDCDERNGELIANRIRENIASELIALPDEEAFSVTASLGVAAYAGETDYEKLLARADAALYEAKESGRNRVVMARSVVPA